MIMTTIMIGVTVIAVIVVAFLVIKGTTYDKSIHTTHPVETKTADKPVEKQGHVTHTKKKKSDSSYSASARREKGEDIHSNPLHPANPLNPLYMDVGEDRSTRSSNEEGTRPSSSSYGDAHTSYSSGSSGSSSYDSSSSSYDSSSSSYDSSSSSYDSGSDSSSW